MLGMKVGHTAVVGTDPLGLTPKRKMVPCKFKLGPFSADDDPPTSAFRARSPMSRPPAHPTTVRRCPVFSNVAPHGLHMYVSIFVEISTHRQPNNVSVPFYSIRE